MPYGWKHENNQSRETPEKSDTIKNIFTRHLFLVHGISYYDNQQKSKNLVRPNFTPIEIYEFIKHIYMSERL